MASRLERLVSIDAYIRAGNYPSLQKLCQLFEVRSRTIYSDLRELRELFGLDIRYDRERNGYYNADPSKTLPPMAMSHEEALLLTLAIELLASSFGPSFRGALARAHEMMRTSDDQSFSWIRDFIELEDRANCEVSCNVLVAVANAAMRKQPAVLTVQPVKIYYEEGHWKLISRPYHEEGVTRLLETLLCAVTDVELVDDGNGHDMKTGGDDRTGNDKP